MSDDGYVVNPEWNEAPIFITPHPDHTVKKWVSMTGTSIQSAASLHKDIPPIIRLLSFLPCVSSYLRNVAWATGTLKDGLIEEQLQRRRDNAANDDRISELEKANLANMETRDGEIDRLNQQNCTLAKSNTKLNREIEVLKRRVSQEWKTHGTGIRLTRQNVAGVSANIFDEIQRAATQSDTKTVMVYNEISFGEWVADESGAY